jgi:hypothetical protein
MMPKKIRIDPSMDYTQGGLDGILGEFNRFNFDRM